MELSLLTKTGNVIVNLAGFFADRSKLSSYSCVDDVNDRKS